MKALDTVPLRRVNSPVVFRSVEMCFNGAKFWQLGWFSGGDSLELGSADVMSPRMVTMESFVHGLNPGGATPKVIKINGPTSTDLYVSFNWKSGHNSQTQEAGNLVTIVRQGGEGNAGNVQASELLAKLSAGASFTGTDYFSTGEDVTITVNSIDTTLGKATITVSSTVEPVRYDYQMTTLPDPIFFSVS